jgi:hypothetical protein
MEVFGAKFGNKKEQAAWRRFGPLDTSWSALRSCENTGHVEQAAAAGNQS